MSDLALLGIGGAHVDRIGRWHTAGPDGVSNPGTIAECVGGCMINTLRVAKMLGVGRTGLISARGSDSAGMMVADALEKADIEDHCALFPDRHTAQYMAIMDGEGEVRAALADMDLYETALPEHLRQTGPSALIGDAGKVVVDANLAPDGIGQVAGLARGPLMALAVSPAKAPRLSGHGSLVDLVCMNRRELATLTGVPEQRPLQEALDALQALGFERAVVSDGAQPVTVLDKGDIEPIPVIGAGQVRDVTGAGDALAGTIAALWPDMVLADAVRLGVAAAALTVGVEGPLHGRLTLERLRNLTGQTNSMEHRR